MLAFVRLDLDLGQLGHAHDLHHPQNGSRWARDPQRRIAIP
jgi:hypothetical protein